MTEQTKQITFEGQTYTVPVWVNWFTVDLDGELCGYNANPFLDDGCFYPSDGGKLGVFILRPSQDLL